MDYSERQRVTDLFRRQYSPEKYAVAEHGIGWARIDATVNGELIRVLARITADSVTFTREIQHCK